MNPREIPFEDWHRIEAIAFEKIDENFVDENNLDMSPPIPVDLAQGKIVGFGPNRFLVLYAAQSGFTRIFWVNDASEAEPVAIGSGMPTPTRGQIVRLRRSDADLSLIAGHLFEIDVALEKYITLRGVSDIKRRWNGRNQPPYLSFDHDDEEITPALFTSFFWRYYELTDYAMEDAQHFMREFRAANYPPEEEKKPASRRRR